MPKEAIMRVAGIVVLALLTACSANDGGQDDPLPAASLADEGESVSVFDVGEGQCYNSPDTANVDEVNIVDCAEPHQYEVYALVEHPAGPDEEYPGDEAISAFSDDECLGDTFSDYVGTSYEESELFAFVLQPTADTWEAGDREFVCAAYLEDDELEGSVQDSGR